MKKMIRIISMLLAIVMIFSVVGCQKKTVTKEEWVEVEDDEAVKDDETGDKSEDSSKEQANNSANKDNNSSDKTNTSSSSASAKEKKLTGKLELQVFSCIQHL